MDLIDFYSIVIELHRSLDLSLKVVIFHLVSDSEHQVAEDLRRLQETALVFVPQSLDVRPIVMFRQHGEYYAVLVSVGLAQTPNMLEGAKCVAFGSRDRKCCDNLTPGFLIRLKTYIWRQIRMKPFSAWSFSRCALTYPGFPCA